MASSARLVKSTSIAMGTLCLDFELETPDYVFKAGQATLFSFPPEDPVADKSRFFSFCSAPSERPSLSIATRITPGSAYKRALSELRPGQRLLLGEPEGDFTLPAPAASPQTLVFLAGGIGITPFRSMIRELRLTNASSFRIHLMTVNRTKNDTPFLAECREWNANGSVRWDPVTTKEGETTENRRQERIEEGLTRVLEEAGDTALIYLAGPPSMVDTLHQTVLGRFLVSDEQIKTDMFFGYLSRPEPSKSPSS